MTKNADIEKLVDMIFAMAKEYALNLKRENHQRKQRKKARLSTMAKAILELEMPESCRKCKLSKWETWEYDIDTWTNVLVCAVLGGECTDEGRRPDCPLKLVEDKEAQYE